MSTDRKSHRTCSVFILFGNIAFCNMCKDVSHKWLTCLQTSGNRIVVRFKKIRISARLHPIPVTPANDS